MQLPLICLFCAYCYDPQHPAAPRFLTDTRRECAKLANYRLPRLRLQKGTVNPAAPACAAFEPCQGVPRDMYATSDEAGDRYFDLLVAAEARAEREGDTGDSVPPHYPPFSATCAECACRLPDPLTGDSSRGTCAAGHAQGVFHVAYHGCTHFQPDGLHAALPYVNPFAN